MDQETRENITQPAHNGDSVRAPQAPPPRKALSGAAARTADPNPGRAEQRRRWIFNLENLLGPINALLVNPSVSDIFRNPNGTIFVHYVNRAPEEIKWEMSDDTAIQIISTVAGLRDQQCSTDKPMLLSVLPDGSRFSAVIPPVSYPGPQFSIRKHAIFERTFGDYIKDGSLSEAQAATLRKLIHEKKNLLIVGQTGSGKALDDNTPVFTPLGQTRIADLHIGDHVLADDGRPYQVNGVFPQGSRAAWEVQFEDGERAICDDDHLWSVRDLQTRELSVMPFRAIREQMPHNSKPRYAVPGALLIFAGSQIDNAWIAGAQSRAKGRAISSRELCATVSSRRLFAFGYLGVPQAKINGELESELETQAPSPSLGLLIRSLGGSARLDGRSKLKVWLPANGMPREHRIVGFREVDPRPMTCISIDSPNRCFVIGGVDGTGVIITHNTTFANAILREMTDAANDEERFAIFEDTPELQCQHANSFFWNTYEPAGIDMLTLLSNVLRHQPTRICVGELRGAEAHVLVKAWMTAHEGGLTTIHAKNAIGALLRLEDLIREGGVEPSKPNIAEVIHVIVTLRKENNRWSIAEIKRLTSATEKGYHLSDA